MGPRLTAEQEYGDDARTAVICDGDRFAVEGGLNSRYGGRFATLRAWGGSIPNVLYVPTPQAPTAGAPPRTGLDTRQCTGRRIDLPAGAAIPAPMPRRSPLLLLEP